MPNFSNTQVLPSRFGKGLFASENIPPHSIIGLITGTPLTFAETLFLGDKESHSIQIAKDKYLLCDPPFLYSNHSCHPNCAINNKLQLYALRPITAGEELLWDYSTSMLERHWTMQCSCGHVQCRKTITDFDLLPQVVQELYMKEKMVLPFIVKHLQSMQRINERRA